MEEARGPMGIRKDLHIKTILELDDVKRRWTEVHGKAPTQNDVDRMFADFVPMQLDVLRDYAQLLPDCAETMNTLRKEFNMKIGCSTGARADSPH